MEKVQVRALLPAVCETSRLPIEYDGAFSRFVRSQDSFSFDYDRRFAWECVSCDEDGYPTVLDEESIPPILGLPPGFTVVNHMVVEFATQGEWVYAVYNYDGGHRIIRRRGEPGRGGINSTSMFFEEMLRELGANNE